MAKKLTEAEKLYRKYLKLTIKMSEEKSPRLSAILADNAFKQAIQFARCVYDDMSQHNNFLEVAAFEAMISNIKKCKKCKCMNKELDSMLKYVDDGRVFYHSFADEPEVAQWDEEYELTASLLDEYLTNAGMPFCNYLNVALFLEWLIRDGHVETVTPDKMESIKFMDKMLL